ncbi:hypothetical protein FTO74_00345 [Granulicella sp. WH15]|uniref:hypothetical protein n=1 Tax=Granulicella sp. WH15 TaxID=2602070 RepID=UPI00136707A9|nr:hypothetical protein [Granulicella sp. WH15]QHN01997.1 hypothetical protein FTO74_00345 [Granulicella sp. WH15]
MIPSSPMLRLRKLTTCAVFAGTLALTPVALRAQTPAATTLSTEQLVTSTVHDAWIASGKDETVFFGMIETLAELSAKNRGITLPDDAAAGKRMGEYIKRTAKADTDQLLYVVVDKAVVWTSKHAAAKPAN